MNDWDKLIKDRYVFWLLFGLVLIGIYWFCDNFVEWNTEIIITPGFLGK